MLGPLAAVNFIECSQIILLDRFFFFLLLLRWAENYINHFMFIELFWLLISTDCLKVVLYLFFVLFDHITSGNLSFLI